MLEGTPKDFNIENIFFDNVLHQLQNDNVQYYPNFCPN